ncbi:uncharacterized protein LOC100902799 [Galendromus occidentalis]|uniref:Uncharacterized protein LOC100902799 n=1 Tax=Galendromus occidentalis TaxID=34638 RepID=A0AAJ6QWI1_9ACAR|nr:uncharacterized protein LOC100902799 [Galendromus occidentalis]
MPWFFVNYLHQEPKVRAAVKRADETFIGKQIRRSSKPLVELRTLSETGVSTRLLERIVEYFRERNEPVELLFDKDFDYRNLLRIFRSHYNEIVLFLKEFAETEELDDELLRAVHVYIDYIKFDEILLRFSPDLTKNPLFEMMQGSVDRES